MSHSRIGCICLTFPTVQKTHVYLKEPSDGILSELIIALDAIFMFFSLLGVLKLPAKLNVYLHVLHLLPLM